MYMSPPSRLLPNARAAARPAAGEDRTTDPDSRNVKTPRSYTQGYNAQAVVNEHQIVLAADVTVSSPDFELLQPMPDEVGLPPGAA
jgi:hypothetical protein